MEYRISMLPAMRRMAYAVLLTLGLFWSSSVFAEVRAGFVNIAKVLEEAPQAEEARKKLESEFAPRDNELVESQKKVKQLEDKLARDGLVMGEPERRDLERQIMTLKRDLKRAREEFGDDLNLRRNDELSKLQRLVIDAIVALARENGYDIILSDNNVLYASDKVDITEQVLKRLQEQYTRPSGGAESGAGVRP